MSENTTNISATAFQFALSSFIIERSNMQFGKSFCFADIKAFVYISPAYSLPK